ncbi:hypothetical protein FDG2_5031 [Candidatus Protofrankia californiensis]|uniref:Uncharacterized protein n=1 Tax=Candidatus Protofrankia californiensis TaxID=1839754 RepID=A0A1C3PAP4_9ACTN|nr:hypothetical protein FDG2_5031 [Candidatus Protofrankia californiensis]
MASEKRQLPMNVEGLFFVDSECTDRENCQGIAGVARVPGVAQSTRLRVREAAAQPRYVASPLASRLASGRGVVVPRI